MSKVKVETKVESKVTLELTVEEALALEAMTVYGLDQFLGVFYDHLGKHYLKPNEKGLNSLFNLIRNDLSSELNKLAMLQKEINKLK